MGKKNKIQKDSKLIVKQSGITWDDLTKGQKGAVKRFEEWFYAKKSKKNMILRFGGLAGCGKDYLLQYLIEKHDFTTADCYVVAYTGQAVNIMRQNGILAKTIHSTFMHAHEEPVIKDGRILTKRGIPITKLVWKPIKRIPSSVKLIIINEASFVSDDIEKLIARYNVPILELGDPLQLPPVTGKQCFKMSNLDYFIDGVVRQRKDSLIYLLSRELRDGVAIDTKKYHGEVQFFYALDSIEDTFYRLRPFFQYADLIVTGTNKQRQIINDCYREVIVKTDSPYPRKGEKMICRRNDWNMMLGPYPLTNGTIGTAVSSVSRSDVESSIHCYHMDFKPDFIDNEYFENILCDSDFLREPFGSDKMKTYYTPGLKFEYAHAITCHLCQGCTANKVVFMDNFVRDEEYHMRIRYTAVTRARERVDFILPHSQYPGWSDLHNVKHFKFGDIV